MAGKKHEVYKFSSSSASSISSLKEFMASASSQEMEMTTYGSLSYARYNH